MSEILNNGDVVIGKEYKLNDIIIDSINEACSLIANEDSDIKIVHLDMAILRLETAIDFLKCKIHLLDKNVKCGNSPWDPR